MVLTFPGITTSVRPLHPLKLYFARADIPEGMDERYNRLVQAARMHSLPGKEKLQYLRTMISEFTKKDYYQGGYETGLEEGLEKGIEQGIEQGLKTTALTMLKDGMAIALVSKYTGLPIETINSLSRNGVSIR